MSKGYFAIGQAGIVVTKEGAKYLTDITNSSGRPDNTWFATSMKPGSATRIKLQAEVKDLQIKSGFQKAPATNHHIYPGSGITTMLNQALKTDTKTIDYVNVYINSRKGIKDYLIDLVGRGDQTQGIQQVYSSIFWQEYNLVLGPTPRNNEPGDKVDYELLGIQTDAVNAQYQKIIKKVQDKEYRDGLEQFLKTRKIYNGAWILATNSKWNLFASKPPMVNPGTTGFAYDIYPWP